MGKPFQKYIYFIKKNYENMNLNPRNRNRNRNERCVSTTTKRTIA